MGTGGKEGHRKGDRWTTVNHHFERPPGRSCVTWQSLVDKLLKPNNS
jgi:hypothetical protein